MANPIVTPPMTRNKLRNGTAPRASVPAGSEADNAVMLSNHSLAILSDALNSSPEPRLAEQRPEDQTWQSGP